MADLHTNWAYSAVDVAPSPAASGTTLSVTAGTGALFPAAPFNVVVCPASTRPSTTNAEIVRVTSKGGGDNWTIVRTQEGSAARTIVVGDAVTLAITVKTLTDAELTITDGVNSWPTGGTVRFSAANGIGLGINGSTITFSHNGLTSQSAQNALAANGNFNFQTLSFSNAGGVSFSTSAGGAIIGFHNGLTTAAASNHSHGNPQLNLTNLSGTTASASNGFTLSLSANPPFVAGVSNLGNTDGATGVSSTRMVLVGSNNITLSQTTGAAGLTISIFGGAGGAGNTGFISAGAATASLGTVVFSNSNGIGFGIAGQTVTASHNGLTSQSNQNVTAANGGFAFQTLSFSNANGIGWSTSAGSAIVASHNGLTTARASNDGVGLNTAQTNVTWTVNSSGISLNAAGYAGTGTSVTGALMTLNSNGLALSITHPGTLSVFAQSLTTLSTSGTIPFNSLQFAGFGIASVGVSNGSVVISVPSGGGAGDGVVSMGMSTEGNTAGTTGTVSSGRYIFVGSGPISLSQSLNGQSGTLSIAGPATSSLSATGIISISTNGSTISIGAGRTLSGSALGPYAGLGEAMPIVSSGSLGQNSLYIVPIQVEDYLTADHLRMPVFVTNSSSAAASVQKGATFRVGLYSRHSTNATVITLISSTSYTIAASHNSNVSWGQSLITAIGNSTSYSTLTASSGGLNLSSSLHGQREFIMPMSTLLSPGEYWLAVAQSTSSAGAGGNVLGISNLIGSFHTFNRVGVATNATNRGWMASMMLGTYSATTAGLPGGISQTQVNQLGQGPIFYAGMGTT